MWSVFFIFPKRRARVLIFASSYSWTMLIPFPYEYTESFRYNVGLWKRRISPSVHFSFLSFLLLASYINAAASKPYIHESDGNLTNATICAWWILIQDIMALKMGLWKCGSYLNTGHQLLYATRFVSVWGSGQSTHPITSPQACNTAVHITLGPFLRSLESRPCEMWDSHGSEYLDYVWYLDVNEINMTGHVNFRCIYFRLNMIVDRNM
jgi:hypothetical protein